MAKHDWATLKAEYLKGSMSLRELAAQKGISPGTMTARASRDGWEAERSQKQSETVSKAVAKHEAKVVDELAKFNEDDLKIAKALRSKAAALLKTTSSPMALRSLASTFDVAQKMGRLALGATTENAGVSSPQGGPVATTNMTPEEFKQAAREVLDII